MLLLERLEFRCYLGGGCLVAVRYRIPYRDFFLSFFFFLVVCIRTAIKVLQILGIIGISIILIYFLYQKIVCSYDPVSFYRIRIAMR
jgi:hypothetical protein